MLKKAAAAVAVGAGFLMVGSPAFATQGDAMSDINVCHVDVNVIAVPILSNNDSGPCVNPDVDSDHVEVEHSDED